MNIVILEYQNRYLYAYFELQYILIYKHGNKYKFKRDLKYFCLIMVKFKSIKTSGICESKPSHSIRYLRYEILISKINYQQVIIRYYALLLLSAYLLILL